VVDDKEKVRLVFTIILLANALIMSNFLGFSFAARSSGRLTIDVQIVSWVIFVAVLIAANIWLYYAYYKKPQSKSKT